MPQPSHWPVLTHAYLIVAADKDETRSYHQVEEGSTVWSENEIEDGSQDEVDQHDGDPVEDPLLGVMFGVDGGDEGDEVGHHECGNEDEEEEDDAGS